MSYDRFSSWGGGSEIDGDDDQVDSSEQKQEKSIDLNSGQEGELSLIEELSSLDSGEIVERQVPTEVFDEVWRYFKRKQKHLLPSYKGGIMKFKKA